MNAVLFARPAGLGHSDGMDARRGSLVSPVAAGGVLLAAVVLYVTATSRATAVWIAPFGLGLVIAAAWTHHSERWSPRWLWILLGVAALALVALGVWALVYTSQHPPVAV